MVRKSQYTILIIVILIISTTALLSAAELSGADKRLSVFGGIGISGARGDYPSEYDAGVEFSFYPGLRLRVDELILPDTFTMFDFGYLETGFVGYVTPTDTHFWNTYSYLNMNVMIGKTFDKLYYAGGLYLGIGLDAYSYREYEDSWVYFEPNGDFGLVAEVGTDIASFLSIGVQGRYGLKSIGSKVDIKNWGILSTVSIHFLNF